MKKAPLAARTHFPLAVVAAIALGGILIVVTGCSRGANRVTPKVHDRDSHDSHNDHADGEAGHDDHEGHAHGDVELVDIGTVAEGAIELAMIEERALDEGFAANGRVVPRPNQVAQVGPLVSGRIVKLSVAEGQRVKSGQVLAYVESTEVTHAQAAYQQASSRLKAAQERLQNVKKLAGEGVFTAKPVDEVRRERAEVASDLATMRAEQQGARAEGDAAIKVAEAAVATAEARVKVAETELDRRTTLVAAGSGQHRPLEEAKREKAEAEAALRTAESGLKAADSQRQRVQKLKELGTAPQREVESADASHAEARASVDNAKARLAIAQQALAREQKIFDEKIHSRGEIRFAEAAVAEAASLATPRA